MKENMDNKRKGVWSSGRLTIGIISIVLFLFIALQSCAVGVGNALQENNSTSGVQGYYVHLYIWSVEFWEL